MIDFMTFLMWVLPIIGIAGLTYEIGFLRGYKTCVSDAEWGERMADEEMAKEGDEGN